MSKFIAIPYTLPLLYYRRFGQNGFHLHLKKLLGKK